MRRVLLLTLLLVSFQKIISQDQKKETPKDTVKTKLKKSLKNVLKGTSDEMSSKILKELLEEVTPKKTETVKIGWENKGAFTLLFNQTAFNADWQSGGTSNVATNTTFLYQLIYRKKGLIWENKVDGDFGLTFLKGENFLRKTNDRIEINTRLSEQIKESTWNYSFFANFKTQFIKGYAYSKEEGTEETIRTEETRIFSPASFQSGPGILWKKKEKYTVNIAPLTSRITIVNDMFTSAEDYADGDYFGVDKYKSSRFEFGGSVAANFKTNISKNLKIENTLNLYSNYIEDPFNIDLDYTFKLDLLISKRFTANSTFQAIYDDNATSAFQIRQLSGIGFKYAF
ncbi:DUF3078 domain-containing protein [Aquimarina hainanensis]|uniref:DUF3078 domain-containing protein n=1 Tax=Aquimarina hainanensis TaxID=1578017 RepID=A0ABW5N384_9FLAO